MGSLRLHNFGLKIEPPLQKEAKVAFNFAAFQKFTYQFTVFDIAIAIIFFVVVFCVALTNGEERHIF